MVVVDPELISISIITSSAPSFSNAQVVLGSTVAM